MVHSTFYVALKPLVVFDVNHNMMEYIFNIGYRDQCYFQYLSKYNLDSILSESIQLNYSIVFIGNKWTHACIHQMLTI